VSEILKKFKSLCLRSDFLGAFEFSALCSDVWLSVGAWDTWCWTEMLLDLSVFGSSKEQSVCAFYNN